MCDFLHEFSSYIKKMSTGERKNFQRDTGKKLRQRQCASIFVSSVGCCLQSSGQKKKTFEENQRNSKMMLETNRVLAFKSLHPQYIVAHSVNN